MSQQRVIFIHGGLISAKNDQCFALDLRKYVFFKSFKIKVWESFLNDIIFIGISADLKKERKPNLQVLRLAVHDYSELGNFGWYKRPDQLDDFQSSG